MPQRTEQEIMQNWKYMDPPLVSVCCITYNHEPYIRDAIEGFLMQETDFPFEVIIHDDASTDRTAEIVREYAEKYPLIIRPIFQMENQWSKGVKISAVFVWPKARGEYIALCEGDDFWTKKNKLQAQVNCLKEHSNCSICLHTAERLSPDKKNKLGFLGQPGQGDREYKLEEIGNKFFATASFVFRKIFVKNLPFCFQIAEAGDFITLLLLLEKGNGYYIDNVMSVFRSGVPGGAHDRLEKARKNNKQIAHYFLNRRKVLIEFDKYTEFKHHDFIKKFKAFYDFELLLQVALNTRSFCKRLRFINIYKKYYGYSRYKFIIRLLCPNFYNSLSALKTKFFSNADRSN